MLSLSKAKQILENDLKFTHLNLSEKEKIACLYFLIFRKWQKNQIILEGKKIYDKIDYEIIVNLKALETGKSIDQVKKELDIKCDF